MDGIGLYFTFVALPSCLFSAYVAAEKGRSMGLWAALGFAFGIYALIAIAGVPPLGLEEEAPAEVRFPVDEEAERAVREMKKRPTP